MKIRDKYLRLTGDNRTPKEYINLATLCDDALHWNTKNETELEIKTLIIARDYVNDMINNAKVKHNEVK